jgi:hypothetical protein
MDAPFNPNMMLGIKRFFDNEDSREPGQDVYDDVFDVDMFLPLQRKRELARMMQIARSYNPRVVYEIGTCDGGGLYHWCKSIVGVERVIAAEVRGTPYQKEFEFAFPNIDFLWIGESSYAESTLNRIREWLDGDAIDAVFIDGDKSRFELDFDLILNSMNSPSVMFMHDITDPSPGEAFRNVISRGYRHESIIDKTDSIEAVEREKNGMPVKNGYEQWLRHWHGRSCGVGVIYKDI